MFNFERLQAGLPQAAAPSYIYNINYVGIKDIGLVQGYVVGKCTIDCGFH